MILNALIHFAAGVALLLLIRHIDWRTETEKLDAIRFVLSAHAPHAVSGMAIAELAGIGRSSIYILLNKMVDAGVVERITESRHYGPAYYWKIRLDAGGHAETRT